MIIHVTTHVHTHVYIYIHIDMVVFYCGHSSPMTPSSASPLLLCWKKYMVEFKKKKLKKL